MREVDIPTNGAGTIGCLYVKIKSNKSRCRPYITSFHKINQDGSQAPKIKWIKGKIKEIAIKLEENNGRKAGWTRIWY